jgi:hypothetical protein
MTTNVMVMSLGDVAVVVAILLVVFLRTPFSFT